QILNPDLARAAAGESECEPLSVGRDYWLGMVAGVVRKLYGYAGRSGGVEMGAAARTRRVHYPSASRKPRHIVNGCWSIDDFEPSAAGYYDPAAHDESE